jgi:hypothetical protein
VFARFSVLRALLGLAACSAILVLAPSAFAAQTLSVTCATSPCPAGGDPAATTAINFDTAAGAPSGLTVQLAAGFLADVASAPAQTCLQNSSGTDPSTCQIGTGSIAVTLFPAPLPASAYLVKGSGSNLAGVDIVAALPLGGSLTVTGEISLKQLAGGAVVADLTVSSSALNFATSMSLTLNGTLTSSPFTRMPSACAPATPTSLTVSYASSTESSTASPDINTSATCAALPFAPNFTASATQDASDQGVAVQTSVDVSAADAATKQVSITFPGGTLAPNLAELGNACGAADPTTCPSSASVGTVSATSSLLSTPLTGNAVLLAGGGTSGRAPGYYLAIVLNSPIQVVLIGNVSISSAGITSTFAGLPDIPLTDLTISLAGGTNSLFDVMSCNQTTLTGSFTGQNGVAPSPSMAAVNVTNCRVSLPAQSQSIAVTPCGSCNPGSTGFAAGGDSSVTTDVRLDTTAGAPTNTTVQLASGWLANVEANPACLNNPSGTDPASCQVGGGTLTTSTGSATFTAFLVKPSAGNLAGVDIVSQLAPTPLATGQVSVKQLASGPVVADLSLPIPSVAGFVTGVRLSLNGTLNGNPFGRMPTACSPATPTSLSVNYSTKAETSSASPDVNVSATCHSLPFAPAFSASAVEDASDNGVAITTDIKVPAGQAATGQTVLSIPIGTFTPNGAALSHACANPDPSSCPSSSDVGTATATSPLLPGSLSGNVVMLSGGGASGRPTGLSLAVVLTSPVKTVLYGTIAVGQPLTTTFANLPDLPLSDLNIVLSGGPNSVFNVGSCAPTTLSAAFTGQNGATPAASKAPVTVQGCHAAAGGGSGPGSCPPGKPKVLRSRLSGLAAGKPALKLHPIAGKCAPALNKISVKLGGGLAFENRVKGLKITKGAAIKSAVIEHGVLTVYLRRAVTTFTLTIPSSMLAENPALRAAARKHEQSAKASVTLADYKRTATTVSVKLS